jgi:predicted acyltransferase
MKTTVNSERLYSLDALRGFDMFWIIGAEELFHRMAEVSPSPFWEFFSGQFQHPLWHGFTSYDLIFPLFLFLAGVATPYSVGKQMEQGHSKKSLLIRVIKRGLILVLLGIIYNNGLRLLPFEEIRFPSVLGRIGLAYMFANIIYIYTSVRARYFWIGGLLLGYWALLAFMAAPGFASGDLSIEGNIVSYLDRLILPGHLYRDIHDPEGLFATIPAIATGLLGVYTGELLRATAPNQKQRTVIRLLLFGVTALILAQIWNLVLPINKNLWTSSFVLQCGGLSVLLMAVFYYVIDVLGYRKWAFFFKVIGMNSILIYLSSHFINWSYTTKAFFGWLGQLVETPYDSVVMVLCLLAVEWAFLYLLYKQRIFLRV